MVSRVWGPDTIQNSTDKRVSPQEDYQDSLGTATHNVGEESDTATFIQSEAEKGNR